MKMFICFCEKSLEPLFLSPTGYVAELSDTALDYLQKFAKIIGQLCSSRQSKQTPVFYSAMRYNSTIPLLVTF